MQRKGSLFAPLLLLQATPYVEGPLCPIDVIAWKNLPPSSHKSTAAKWTRRRRRNCLRSRIKQKSMWQQLRFKLTKASTKYFVWFASAPSVKGQRSPPPTRPNWLQLRHKKLRAEGFFLLGRTSGSGYCGLGDKNSSYGAKTWCARSKESFQKTSSITLLTT